jgi:hypothetical protein
MVGTEDYQPSLRDLVQRGIMDPKALYGQLAFEDIRAAADLLYPFYEGVQHAREVLHGLEEVGISPDRVTAGLLAKGLDTFAASFDKLLAALAKKRPRRVDRRQPTGGVCVSRSRAFGLASWRSIPAVEQRFDRHHQQQCPRESHEARAHPMRTNLHRRHLPSPFLGSLSRRSRSGHRRHLRSYAFHMGVSKGMSFPLSRR